MAEDEDPTVGGRVPSEAFWRGVINPPDEKRRKRDREFWSKQYGREVTDEEVLEINHNLFGLVKLLMKIQARQDAIAAGQRVVDEEKVRKLRWTLRGLSEQIESMQKMIRRWDKGDAQRLALEQALFALQQEEVSRRDELTTELSPRDSRTEAPPVSGGTLADLPPSSSAEQAQPARRRSRRS